MQGEEQKSGTSPLSERESLGKAIRVRRTELDLSRSELADGAELSYPYLSEIENGGKWPSEKALRRLAEALDLQDADALRALAESYASGEAPPPRPTLRLQTTAGATDHVSGPASGEVRGAALADRARATPIYGAAREADASRPESAELDRVVESLVEERVRQELRRWQEDVLPLLIRAEVLEHLAERERD